MEAKFKNLDSNLKQLTEDNRTLRLGNEKLDSESKLVNEEFEILQRSYEELSLKKQSEVELLTKEINSLIITDKEGK